jgi:hypothetical protein
MEAKRETSLNTNENSKGHPSQARRNLTRTSEPVERSLPKLGNPKPNACLGMINTITGVMIIKYVQYTSQRIVTSDRAVSRMTVPPLPCLQSWGMNLTRNDN